MEMGVPFLGAIPLDPRISEAADAGSPFVVTGSDLPAAEAFQSIVMEIERFVE
jgi:ATP-binding protein involved in chromosome partitioning